MDPIIRLTFFNESAGTQLIGANAGDRFGSAVAGAGDVNGDGVDDIIVGASADSGGGSGAAFVFFGAQDGLDGTFLASSLNGSNGFAIDDSASSVSGLSVAGAGDVNGDGLADLLVGTGGATSEQYVVFGSSSGFPSTVNVDSLDGSNGFRIGGIDPSDRPGFSVGAAGDINGDGLDDILVGAPDSEANGFERAGAAYVIFGSTLAIDSKSVCSVEGGDIDALPHWPRR
ncbi:MAG: integrin alpha, partial [Pseudomonadota bacterium]